MFEGRPEHREVAHNGSFHWNSLGENGGNQIEGNAYKGSRLRRTKRRSKTWDDSICWTLEHGIQWQFCAERLLNNLVHNFTTGPNKIILALGILADDTHRAQAEIRHLQFAYPSQTRQRSTLTKHLGPTLEEVFFGVPEWQQTTYRVRKLRPNFVGVDEGHKVADCVFGSVLVDVAFHSLALLGGIGNNFPASFR